MSQYLMRLFFFMVFSVIGMAAIAVAILAPPVAEYYSDKAALTAQQQRIDKLENLYRQRNELLKNSTAPDVIERAAIAKLGYLPKEIDSRDLAPLPRVWPELEQALQQVGEKQPPPPPGLIESYARSITEKPLSRLLFASFGAALVIISLTCFNRSGGSAAPD